MHQRFRHTIGVIDNIEMPAGDVEFCSVILARVAAAFGCDLLPPL